MMRYLTWKMRGLSAAFAVIGTLSWVSPAEAIISKKRWDPKYGGALDDLGWSGEVDFQIHDDCLKSVVSSKWITNLTKGCVNKLSIDSATVTLYDIDELGNNGSAPDVTLAYGGSTLPLGGDNAQLTLRMYVEVDGSKKTLKAVQGSFWIPEFTNASFAKLADYEGAAYWLNFNDNEKNDFNIFSSSAPEGDYAFLSSCSYRKDAAAPTDQSYSTYYSAHKYDVDVKCSQNDGEKFPAILVAVPEPETYLLGLASFGVLGVWARRRRLNAR